MTEEGNGRRRGGRRRHSEEAQSRGSGSQDRPVRRGGNSEPRVAGGSGGSAVDPSAFRAGRAPDREPGTADAAPVTVETDTITATLVGLPTVDVREVAYEHRIDRDRLETGETAQALALFDLHNTSGFPLRWTSSRTRFVGDDGYTYSPSPLSIDRSALGPGIHTGRVEIQPDRRARVATLVEQLPAGVEVVEVVQTLPVRAGDAGSERLVFAVAE